MASFKSVIHAIGHFFTEGVAVAVKAEPILNLIPGIGPEAVLAINTVAGIENLVESAAAGLAKKAAVTAVVTAAAPSVDQATLSTVIDEIVAGFNAIAAAAAKLNPPAPPAS